MKGTKEQEAAKTAVLRQDSANSGSGTVRHLVAGVRVRL